MSDENEYIIQKLRKIKFIARDLKDEHQTINDLYNGLEDIIIHCDVTVETIMNKDREETSWK